MTGITWLHLSDWHQKGSDFKRTEVRDALLRDIRERETQISPDLKQIDFIVFSGDVAFHGKEEEYDAAWKELFKPLLDELKVPPEQLFIVPGNHDLDRDIIKGRNYPEIYKYKTNFASEREVNTCLTTKADLENILNPFEAYKKFIKEHTQQTQPEYGSISSYVISNLNIKLLGINSALIAGRTKSQSDTEISDYGSLFIGVPQIKDYLNQAQNEVDLRIGVIHHPFEWLAEFDRNTSGVKLRNNCHFILCGHQHSPDFVRINGIKGNYVMIPAGASYERGDYRNGYNFVHLDFLKDLGTVYLRRWSTDRVGGKWIQDEDSCDSGKYNFHLSDLFENFQELKDKDASTIPVPDTHPPASLNTTLRYTLRQEEIAKKILDNNIVLFLGADINLCGRTVQNPWQWKPEEKGCPPTNLELAAYLDNNLKNEHNLTNYLEKVGCPLYDKKPTYKNCPIYTREITHLALQHVSQYFWLLDSERLNSTIVNDIYDKNYQPNQLHLFLAELPSLLNNYYDLKGEQVKYPLIVTTCFDQTLESALIEKKQQFDLVSYCDNNNDKFSYQKIENQKSLENPIPISIPNGYCWFNDRPVILRLYGPGLGQSKDNPNPRFAITENDFLNYLSRQSYQKLPGNLIEKLTNNSILFLGYSLSYWNFRGIVHSLRSLLQNKGKWWAIQENPETFDDQLWKIYGNQYGYSDQQRQFKLWTQQNIFSLKNFIDQLKQELEFQIEKLKKIRSMY